MKLTHFLLVFTFCCGFALAKTSSKIPSPCSLWTVATPSPNLPVENVNDSKIEFYHLNAGDIESTEKRISLRQRRGPCACIDLNCGCCAGMEVQKFKRKLCTNFTYDPNEFQVELNVMNNEQVVYQNMFTAKNPPPMCMPVPYTPAQMCIKLFNIFTPGRNLHMCMDIETKVQEKPYLVLHFDCMRMGQDGFKYPLKPEENGGEVGTGGGGGGGGGGGLFGTGLFQNGLFGNRPSQTTQPPAVTTEVPQIDTDIFDPITEIKIKP